MLSRVGVFWVGILLAFSGCVSGGSGAREVGTSTSNSDPAASSSPDGPPSTATTVEAGQGAGEIEGNVVDPEIVPIVGAEVTIRAGAGSSRAPITVLSDQAGAFRVKGLEPGTYELQAHADGYHDGKAQRIQLQPEAPNKVTLILDPLKRAEAYHESSSYRANTTFSFCAFVAGTPFCYGGWSGQSTAMVEVDEFLSGTLTALLLETKLTPAHSACPGGVRHDVWSPQEPKQMKNLVTVPFHWHNQPYDGSNPARLLIPREGEEETAMMSPARTEANGGVTIQTTGKWNLSFERQLPPTLDAPVDAACAVNVYLETYVTRFFLEAPPSDFTMFA